MTDALMKCQYNGFLTKGVY